MADDALVQAKTQADLQTLVDISTKWQTEIKGAWSTENYTALFCRPGALPFLEVGGTYLQVQQGTGSIQVNRTTMKEGSEEFYLGVTLKSGGLHR